MVPEPRAAHTCTYMSDNKVVLFGGKISHLHRQSPYELQFVNLKGRTLTTRTNDLFILDTSSLTWSNK